ncbi:MAG: ATP-binding protein, partial [Alphaproteobacteria bacterium]
MMARNLRHKLIGKATIMLVGAVVFCVLEVGIALYFKDDLIRDFDRLRELRQHEQELIVAKITNMNLLADLSLLTLPFAERPDELIAEWRRRLIVLAEAEKAILATGAGTMPDPGLRQALERLQGLRDAPLGDADLRDFAAQLGATLRDYERELNGRLEAVRSSHDNLAQAYHRKSNADALVVLVIGLFGFALATIVVAVFFSRLVKALQQLQQRAKDIMVGNYGDHLSIERNDEVRDLTDAVNDMARSLEQHERQAADFQHRLRQEEKIFTLGTFAAGIAHDIGNPIQAVSAICEQIRHSFAADHSKENIAENIGRLDLVIEEANRLALTIREITDFTRPDLTEMQPTNINDVISSTIRLLHYDPRFQGITLTAEWNKDLPMVYAVPDHLIQVVMNALINAADAIADGAGEIVVTAREEDSGVLITIADNGSGMSREVLSQAMEPFFTTKPQGKGTGLGL